MDNIVRVSHIDGFLGIQVYKCLHKGRAFTHHSETRNRNAGYYEMKLAMVEDGNWDDVVEKLEKGEFEYC